MSGCRPALLASDSTAFANVACTISSAAARSCMTPYTNRSNRNSCSSWSVAGRDASAETHESLSIVGDFPTNITLRRTDGRECFNYFQVVAIWDDTEQRSDHFGNAIWRMRRDSPSRPRPRGRPSGRFTSRREVIEIPRMEFLQSHSERLARQTTRGVRSSLRGRSAMKCRAARSRVDVSAYRPVVRDRSRSDR